jgi:putative ABC transport system ATP-binding protein
MIGNKLPPVIEGPALPFDGPSFRTRGVKTKSVQAFHTSSDAAQTHLPVSRDDNLSLTETTRVVPVGTSASDPDRAKLQHIKDGQSCAVEVVDLKKGYGSVTAASFELDLSQPFTGTDDQLNLRNCQVNLAPDTLFSESCHLDLNSPAHSSDDRTKPFSNGGPALEVRNLRKVYKTGKIEYEALRGATFSVAKGEFVAIVGPSGSGKSTLMNLIGSLDRPTEGEVLIDGIPVSSMDDNQFATLRNQKIGLVFQAFNLVNYLTACQNVELPLVAGGVDPSTRMKEAMELLKSLGLEGKEYKKPRELSGGEQQRVAVARALINKPALILADEPTGNLDTKSAEGVVTLLREVSVEKGVTVVMITHNLDLTKDCNRIIHIRDGLIEKVEERDN